MLKKKAKAEDNGAPVTDASGESAKMRRNSCHNIYVYYEIHRCYGPVHGGYTSFG